MNEQEYASEYAESLSEWDRRRARSQQTDIGPSGIGWCRQQAVYVVKQQEPTDDRNTLPAILGTFIHAGAAEARAQANPRLLIEVEVTIKIDVPGYGVAEIVGHVDEIDPDENSVTDLKTVDDIGWVKHRGVSQGQAWQRHMYALGAIQHGLVDPNRPVIVRNVFIERGGKTEPYVIQSEFDPTLTDEIGAWLSDVFYAVQHDEDASRDVVASICEKTCEFFTVCRGALPVEEGGEWITDPDRLSAIDMWVKARALEGQAKELKTAARAALLGVNGMTDDWQVRTVHVNETEVAGFTRAASDRIDVIPRKKGKAKK